MSGTALPTPVLTPAEQEALSIEKVVVQSENEAYLKAHPEVQELMKDFMAKLLDTKPADVLKFAVNHFTGGGTVAGK